MFNIFEKQGHSFTSKSPDHCSWSGDVKRSEEPNMTHYRIGGITVATWRRGVAGMSQLLNATGQDTF